MKSIVYILIIVFTAGILYSAIPNLTPKRKQVVELQCVSKNPEPGLLLESSQIIKSRLKEYGLQNFQVTPDPQYGSIHLEFSEKFDLKEVSPLLTATGRIGFYETCDRLEVIKLLGKGDELGSLLNISPEDTSVINSPAILGYCKPGLVPQVDSWLAQHYVSKPGEGIRFSWSKNSNEKGDYFLYLLKARSVLGKQQIQESSVNKSGESHELMIRFNENGTLVWQSLSKSNMSKSIAVVMDYVVFAAPIIRDEIKGGRCSISGSFSLEEITLLKSLINNGDLPLDFKIVE
jgi:hypothetical protein